MTGSSVSEVHYRCLAVLVEAVDIDPVFVIVRRGGIMNEFHRTFRIAVSVGNDLIEIIIGIVYDKRWGAGKISVRPCIRQNVHSYTCRLSSLVLCELHRLNKKIAVRIAYKPVFIKIHLRCPFSCRIQIKGQKMERCPYPCHLHDSQKIRLGIHKL